MKEIERYPLIRHKAEMIARQTLKLINTVSKDLPDEGMPYKAQCLLEYLIEELKKAV